MAVARRYPCTGCAAAVPVRGLRDHLFLRILLHLSAAAGRTGGRGRWRPAGSGKGRRIAGRRGMSAIEPSGLALFWAGVIVVAILILDDFDLGAGILYGTTGDAALRDEMMAAISPFWDGNETWLVVIGASRPQLHRANINRH